MSHRTSDLSIRTFTPHTLHSILAFVTPYIDGAQSIEHEPEIHSG
jgi:hypothetical protein